MVVIYLAINYLPQEAKNVNVCCMDKVISEPSKLPDGFPIDPHQTFLGVRTKCGQTLCQTGWRPLFDPNF